SGYRQACAAKPAGQRTAAYQRFLLVSVVGSLSKYQNADSLACIGRPRPKDDFPRMGRLFAVSATRGVHGTHRGMARADNSQHYLFGNCLSVSGIELGFCGDRDRGGELRPNRLRSRVGEPPVVAARTRAAPE